ncbi:MAG: serine/threonine-protein phosphatase [Clostridia bacterium]|nr:serine/threonine-protein phosphatase [Clostridia bacterium]
MINTKDEQFLTEQTSFGDFAILSAIGDRTEQQDSFGYLIDYDLGLFIVCDGMGGHECGKLASEYAVQEFVACFRERMPNENMRERLHKCAIAADRRVALLAADKGGGVVSGCTLLAVVIDADKLHWCSVGDSRAYLMRGGEFVQFTKDQNYLTVLDEQLNAGVITRQEYNERRFKGDALINYVGIGDLSFLDYSESPLKLKKNDVIIVMTDGLYRLVNEEDMKQLTENFGNVSDAIRALYTKANRIANRQKIKRDNITAILIKYK